MTGWEALSELARRLADDGLAIAQIHHRGKIPIDEWIHNSHTASLHADADIDCVVISDGGRYTL